MSTKITATTDDRIFNHQDYFLESLMAKKCLTDIYLLSGIRLQGYINRCDNYTILLAASPEVEDVAVMQMIYKHAISTVSASK